MQLVEAKRRVLSEAAQRRTEERNQQELKEWEGRYAYRETEASRREGEDRLKDLTVSLGQHMEV